MAISSKHSGGYPSASATNLPVANLSASDRWRALGGSDGAPRQLEEGCRWVGAATAEIDKELIRQCSEGNDAGKTTDLNFHFKFIEQISGLEQLAPQLRTLDLSTNNIRTIEGLAGMTKLRELKLDSCQISRIQNLEQCVSLVSLHLQYNYISTIEGLDAVRSLETLNMDANSLQKIGKGLAKLTKLRELHLSRNQIISLDGLATLASLETLCVNQNKLSNIAAEHVKGLVKLDELRVAENQLQTLSFLVGAKTLPRLAHLVASRNLITLNSLQNFAPLTQLTNMNLAGNLIEEISPAFVSAFPSLDILDVSNNRLHRGVEDVEQLKQIPSLRELSIQGNPFISQTTPEDAQTMLSSIDFLEYLDDRPVERPPEVNVLSLEGGDENDSETFRLTMTNMKGSAGSRPDTATSQQRPGTAGSQRPGTAGSRPGTAQKMAEAGVKDPLMLSKPKLSEKRYATAEQVEQWERQTLSSLSAVQKQIDKTCHHMDQGLEDMTKFLRRADEIIQKGKELNGNMTTSTLSIGESDLPSLSSATIARANAELASEKHDTESRRDSRVKFRLQTAVESGREEDCGEEDDDVELAMPQVSLAPISLTPTYAAFDEEIEEEEPPDNPVIPSPEPEAEEVEDEDLHTGETEASLQGLGPRASRALAAVISKAGSPSPEKSSRVSTPEFRVEARAKDRSGHKMGSQPSQGPRVRPPVAPNRSSNRR